MARIRTVKPEFFTHYELYSAEKESGLPLRLAFEGLWLCSDKEGRFKWQIHQLKLSILPYDEIDFNEVLGALMYYGFILKYEVDKKIYGCVPTLKDHQRITGSEATSESKLPSPENGNILETFWKPQGSNEENNGNTNSGSMGYEEKATTVSISTTSENGSALETSWNQQGITLASRKGKERKGMERKGDENSKTELSPEMTKEDFVNFQGRLIQDTLFIEPLMSGKGIREKSDMLGWIKYFNVHIVTECKIRKDYHEYRKHFKNFLVKWDTSKPPPLNGLTYVTQTPKLKEGDTDKYMKTKRNV